MATSNEPMAVVEIAARRHIADALEALVTCGMANVIEFGAPQLPRMQRLRGAMGRMTRQELAERIGVDRATIGRWERGAARIPQVHRVELASIFGVSVDYLMGLSL